MKPRRSRVKVEDQRFLRRSGNLRVRRQRMRKGLERRWMLLAFLAAVLIAGGALAVQARSLLSRSDLFRVRRIAYQGRRWAPRAALDRRLQAALSRNIFTVDLEALRGRLEDDPWIRTARVRRKLPDTLHVTIGEHRPVALAAVGAGLHLVGADGVTIQPHDPEVLPGPYPVLAGLPEADGEARNRTIRRGTRLIGALAEHHPDLLARVDRIDLGRADANDVHLRDSHIMLRLPPDGGLGTLSSWVRIRDRIDGRFARPARLDLRWRDQIAIITTDGRNSPG
jgi:cell division protein FtsQ